MGPCYDYRSAIASVIVADVQKSPPYGGGVLTTDELLTELRERGVSNADMARALVLPSPRIAELYSGARRLRYEEGKTLIDTFAPDLTGSPISVKQLTPILVACLRNAPKGGWTEQAAEYLAEAVQYGLQLVTSANASLPTSDALAVAGRAASDRLHKALS